MRYVISLRRKPSLTKIEVSTILRYKKQTTRGEFISIHSSMTNEVFHRISPERFSHRETAPDDLPIIDFSSSSTHETTMNPLASLPGAHRKDLLWSLSATSVSYPMGRSVDQFHRCSWISTSFDRMDQRVWSPRENRDVPDFSDR